MNNQTLPANHPGGPNRAFAASPSSVPRPPSSHCFALRSPLATLRPLHSTLLALLISTLALHAWDLDDLVNQADPLGNDWYYLEWAGESFGFFKAVAGSKAIGQDTYRPIYHNEHGLLWVLDGNPNDQFWWVIDPDMNDMAYKIDPAAYPAGMYRQLEGSNWDIIKYWPGTSPDRVFTSDSHTEEENWPITPIYTEHGPHGPVPVWWKMLGAVDLTKHSAHEAPVTVGQLKHVATVAKEYLDGRLDIDGSEWDSAFLESGGANPFSFDAGPDPANRELVNTGQLKFIASAFYRILATHAPGYDVNQRLIEVGFPASDLHTLPPFFPWSGDPSAIDHTAIATLGQLKMVFSFDFDHGRYAAPNPPAPLLGSSPGIDEEKLYVMAHDPNNPDNVSPPYEMGTPNWGNYFMPTNHVDHPEVSGHKWFYSPGFGWIAHDTVNTLDFDGSDPTWVWHREHGWIWLYERTSESGQYLYDLELGVLWANPAWSDPPGKLGWIYAYALWDWIYYEAYDDVNRFRWFYSQRQESYFISPGSSPGQGGLPDVWQLRHFGTLSFGPGDDLSGDGLTLLEAYLLGLDPHVDANQFEPLATLEVFTEDS